MDYETKPTNRSELRLFAKLFRTICGFSMDEPIDLLPFLTGCPNLKGLRTSDMRSFITTYSPETCQRNARKQKMGILSKSKSPFIMVPMKRKPADTECTSFTKSCIRSPINSVSNRFFRVSSQKKRLHIGGLNGL